MPSPLTEIAQSFDELLPNDIAPHHLNEGIPIFAEALTDGLYIDAMHQLLHRNLHEQFEVTPEISSGPFVVLYGSRKTTWAILRHTGTSQQLYLSPTHAMSAKIGGGNLRLSQYAVAESLALERFDDTQTLQLVGSKVVKMREICIKDGKRQVADYQAERTAPALTLRVNTLPFADYEWAFDRRTMRATSISGIRQAESNLTTIFELLAAAGTEESIEHVSRFVGHHMHFVRWKAAQTIFALNNEIGLKAVLRLEADPHPEVQLAARRTLSALA